MSLLSFAQWKSWWSNQGSSHWWRGLPVSLYWKINLTVYQKLSLRGVEYWIWNYRQSQIWSHGISALSRESESWISKIFRSREIKLLNRLLIGHTYDKAYLHMIGSAPSDHCDTYSLSESADHLIPKRQKYNSIRNYVSFFSFFSDKSHLFNKRWRVTQRTDFLY